jgi:hypothetical protein
VIDLARFNDGARFGMDAASFKVTVLSVYRVRLVRVSPNGNDTILVQYKSKMTTPDSSVVIDN